MANHPKIAIRPIIDGRRRGVRESLEDKTMDMARVAADLISSQLRYADGEPVEVIVASETIGRAGEAARVAEEFSTENICAELTVTPCWDYVTEVIDMNPRIQHAVWGINGTERPGAVTLAAAMSAYAQFGVPAFGMYGYDVKDADDEEIPAEVREQILRYARAAVAIGQLKGKNYLQMGSQCMGIAGSMVDRGFFKNYLGLGVESVDMIEIDRRIALGIFDPKTYDTAREWVRRNLVQGEDIVNLEEDFLSPEQTEQQWDYVTKMLIIAEDLLHGNPVLAELGFPEEAAGHNAIVGGFQGQRQWTDYKPNADLMETFLNTTFDWRGPRQTTTFATENDTLNGATMLLGHLLTNKSQMFSDVRTYWSPAAVKRVTGHVLDGIAADGFLDLRNSGATTLDATGAMTDAEGNPVFKEFWNVTEDDQAAALAATTFHPANKPYFRGGGFSTHFATRGGMPVTMARINLLAGIGPVLQIAEGWTVELPDEARSIIEKRTDPAWPTTFFAPRLTGEGAFTSTYEVMNHWGANHGAIGFGHYGADLITLASMLRIPVNMHNVDGTDVFRPRNWAFFGTGDVEAADFRACATYGPFFK
ncbi:L-fucose isomerase [Corynebacterium uterequi]|uniref:L-fucose isomerase n=1 Tax=Corynebacterium uterequi TaxID=1072256 RepID=A0A0G3HLE1_9CORY|nr:L-fucose isomerase [Corynebacterium uterequi]AKK11947.1 L-fucose isomerase [Corynebacterium uterequi]